MPKTEDNSSIHAGQAKLARLVGLIAVIASAVSQEYGSGINFVAPQSLSVYPAIRDLVPLAMFVTGILYLPKVFIYMRFSRLMARAGGTYVWTTRSLGMATGFIIHFLWWIGLIFAIGVLGFSFGTFLSAGLTDIGVPSLWMVTPVGHVIVGLVAIWFIYWLHIRGVGAYGKLVTIALAFVILSALVVVSYGFGSSPQAFTSAVEAKLHLTLNSTVSNVGPSTLSVFLSTCTLFIFAYGGISAAPMLGGEAKNASKTMPRGILWAWLIALCLFTLVAFAIFHTAPWWAMLQLIQSKHTALTTTPGIVGLLSPHWLGALLNLVVALIVGKTIAPQMLSTSRMAFAFSEDGLFPVAFTQTNARKSPRNALLLAAIVGSLSLVQSSLIGWSVGATVRSISILVVLIFLGIGIFNLRWNPRFKNLPWASDISRGPVVLISGILGILFGAILISSVLVVPKQHLAFQPAFQAVIVVVIAVLIYLRASAKLHRQSKRLADIAATLPID